MKKIILISGATAVGKNQIAIEIADFFKKKGLSSNIINADSKQVYKELKILTNQPSELDLKKHKHSLYGFLNVDKHYSLSKWCLDIQGILNDNKNEVCIIVGGTGLYLNAIRFGFSDIPSDLFLKKKLIEDFLEFGIKKLSKKLYELDKIAEKKINPNDSYRIIRALEVFLLSGKSIFEFHNNKKIQLIDSSFLHFHIQIEREKLYKRINDRVECMFFNNVIREIDKVLKLYGQPEFLDKKFFPFAGSIGFAEIKMLIENSIAIEDAKKNIKQFTRNYAKRQLTWFRNSLKICQKERFFLIGDKIEKDIDIEKILLGSFY